MPFRVNARTVLHLGAELISSDAVAFYELIKNAFDARSKRVEINVVVCIPHETYLELRATLVDEERRKHTRIRQEIINRIKQSFTNVINVAAPGAKSLKRKVSEIDTFDDLLVLLDGANYIEINDTGEGMSLKDLNDVYLTIGTRSRLEQREEQVRVLKRVGGKNVKDFRPILGEKGVGRLSAMRLGNFLRVKTSRKGEARWNILEVDWSRFSHASDELITEIDISPQRGELKKEPSQSGTSLHISALASAWTKGDLDKIANYQFSKLTDPFDPESQYKIVLRFNGELIPIPDLNEILFEEAHATVEAEYIIMNGADSLGANPIFTGEINYILRNRRMEFEIDGEDLINFAGLSPTHIRPMISLGPFRMKLYWFNRKLLTQAEGVTDAKLVQNLVKQWAGGLMVYRDGFRVYPYGDPEDDWLDLDSKALSAGGYKVNRQQIVGKVDISSILNPKLVDQTNREGLRDSEEKQVLIHLLQWILKRFRLFMDEIDRKAQAKEPLLDFSDLESRVARQEKLAQLSVRSLVQKHKSFSDDPSLVAIQESLAGIRSLMKQAKSLAESYVKDREQFVHLAGNGLMMEIIGHELTRATNHALTTLAETDRDDLPEDVESLFSTLKAQLNTLQKRLRVLDPLSTRGRQRKTIIDIIAVVQDVLKSHDAQFRRHDINLEFYVEPQRTNPSLRMNAVEGMVIQILENLISNSVYWLDRRKQRSKDFVPEIIVTINTQTKTIYFSDNGPGIRPERKEEIFQPFISTKPAEEGKGLGLYISREIAKYNGAELYLSNEPTMHPDRLNTFALVMEANNK